MTNMHYLLSAAGSATECGTVMDSIISFAPIVVVLIVFYFMLIRPQQKKDKEDRAMRENLEVGDEIVTIGGIYGRVISLKEETIVIESQSDHSKLTIARWALQTNLTVHDDVPSK